MNKLNDQFLSYSDSVDAMRRLRAVTRQIEVFFDLQMRKLTEAAEQLNELNSENELVLKLAADLERQKQLWEQEKNHESQRLVDAGEKLALAWQELEDKQRDQPNHVPESHAPKVKKSTKTETPAIAENSETTLFEMKMLQQQVAEHARRHNNR